MGSRRKSFQPDTKHPRGIGTAVQKKVEQRETGRRQRQYDKKMTAEQFNEMYGDLPDGAFWALAMEYGLDVEDFAAMEGAVQDVEGGPRVQPWPTPAVAEAAGGADHLKDKHPISITIDVTTEDLVAAGAQFHDKPHLMRMDDMVEFLLKPWIGYKLNLMRSQLKWRELKLWHHVPEVDPHGNEINALDRHPTTPVEGSQDCPSSPTGICWYDDQEDPAWDNCVFCGEPDERK